ncbi:hypothetical protein NC651_000114 [Populus alba x Populus x berolinensis]|nr:hypothetical protein NC651_000114 [Populus alba x Populus x berolinensis]
MAADRWQMGLIYTRLQTLVTGHLWRRRAQECKYGGGETTVSWNRLDK